MAMEAFLVNPARKKRKASSGRKRRGGGLPAGLLSKMIRTYGIKRGMKEAWKAHKGTGTRTVKRVRVKAKRRKSVSRKLPGAYHVAGRKHRPVVYGGIKAGQYSRSPFSRSPRINPFGEEVMILGANPKRRKRSKRKATRRHSLRLNPIRRRRVSRRRGLRRNPATAMAISARKPMSLLMPALVGTGGYFAADYIPAAIGMSGSPITRIGVKAGIAFGGGMLVSKFLGAKSGTAFALGVGINIINDALKTYIFKGVGTAGMGAFTVPGLRGFGAMSPYSNVRSPYAN